jgi:hypothetical protein
MTRLRRPARTASGRIWFATGDRRRIHSKQSRHRIHGPAHDVDLASQRAAHDRAKRWHGHKRGIEEPRGRLGGTVSSDWAENSGAKTAKRPGRGRPLPGQSGNPAGKPRGCAQLIDPDPRRAGRHREPEAGQGGHRDGVWVAAPRSCGRCGRFFLPPRCALPIEFPLPPRTGLLLRLPCYSKVWTGGIEFPASGPRGLAGAGFSVAAGSGGAAAGCCTFSVAAGCGAGARPLAL